MLSSVVHEVLTSLALHLLPWFVYASSKDCDKNAQVLTCFSCSPMQLSGPRREKPCLRGFRQSEFETSVLSYRLAGKLKFHL